MARQTRYRRLGLPKILAAYGAVVAAVTIAILVVKPFPVTELAEPIGWAGTFTGGLFGLAGQTRLFPMLCRLPILRSNLLDIDGEWAGYIESNWTRIDARFKNPAISDEEIRKIDLLNVPMRMTISVRLFTINIATEIKLNGRTEPNENSAVSRSVAVRLVRDVETGDAELFHIFENKTLKPSPGDQQKYYGASQMSLKSKEGSEPRLSGEYWTNRNWSKATGTGGTVELIRKAI
jgi:hypothetical protein